MDGGLQVGIFERVDAVCETIERFIVSWGTITMAVVSIINVVSRNLFRISFSWVEEISQFSVVLVTFVGTAYAARKGLHIRMTILTDIAGHRGRKFLTLLTSLGTALFLAYMMWYSVLYVKGLYVMNKYTLGLQIPVYVVMLWVPVGFFLASVQYFMTFWKNLTHESIFIAPSVTEEGAEDGWNLSEGVL